RRGWGIGMGSRSSFRRSSTLFLSGRVVLDEEPTLEGAARRAVAGGPRAEAGGRSRAVGRRAGELAGEAAFEDRHPAADVLAVHRLAAAVEQETGADGDQDAVAVLERLVAVRLEDQRVGHRLGRLRLEDAAVPVVDVGVAPAAP